MADLPDAPRTRKEQFVFLRAAHDGPLSWKALCLALTRQAAGIPALHRTALVAALATPEAHRVADPAALRRGMVAYFDSPSDSNPYGHVVTVAGWAGGQATGDLTDLLVWTNDAVRPGGVDLVRASFFPDRWGDPFMFGATSLNGYDLPGYDRRNNPESIGDALDRAIRDVRRALRRHREAGDSRLVRALAADLAELKETRTRFP